MKPNTSGANNFKNVHIYRLNLFTSDRCFKFRVSKNI